VLADGYLRPDRLSPEQARFVFGWGVLLQLADDLQDVRRIGRDGMLTMFTGARDGPAAGRGDQPHAAFRPARDAVDGGLGGPDCQALKELIQRSSRVHADPERGRGAELYSDGVPGRTRDPLAIPFRLPEQPAPPAREAAGLLMQLFRSGSWRAEEDEPAFPMLPDR